jgi:hypothetical protein
MQSSLASEEWNTSPKVSQYQSQSFSRNKDLVSGLKYSQEYVVESRAPSKRYTYASISENPEKAAALLAVKK